MDYQSMLQLAREHRFQTFTKLQEQAFSQPEVYNQQRDLFVIGETSSGKTLIPILIYAAALREAQENGEPLPKMLFVVPYRALAAQKYQEISNFFQKEQLTVVQSTGEFRQDDDAVQRGQVNIAVIITEKVYKYQARNADFLSQYDYLVLDEIGLVDSADRGIRLDFIFAWAHSQKKLTGLPRTIALGTPFYDWSAYISSYEFLSVQISDRPVKLTEINTNYDQTSITQVDPGGVLQPLRMVTAKDLERLESRYEVAMTRCVHANCLCPIRYAPRVDPSQPCPATGKSCLYPVEFLPEGCRKGMQFILLKICREHLLKGHQLLIFVNDREKVKQLCMFLYQQLQDLLPKAPEPEVCRREILSACGLEGDDVFGILEYEDGSSVELEYYQAFMSGVGFHSAALPNELRTYVERKLLGSREMKIVCSTETLAFGVNSSVDVVVVADLYKHEGTDIRMLTLNEYQNYAGRAGRLRPDLVAEEARGYVYTLIAQKQMEVWQNIRLNSRPERLYSRFHTENNQRLPFFLMNILPTTTETAIPLDQLVDIVSSLPQDGTSTAEVLSEKVGSGLDFLIRYKLAHRVRSRGRGRKATDTRDRYCLTAQGSNLRGYIVDSDDYLRVLGALEEYTDSLFLDSDKITFLYRLLQTRHAESGLNAVFSGSETRWKLKDLQEYIRVRAVESGHTLSWLRDCRSEKVLSILAATLAWSEGESPKTLYRQFGMHYALLARVAEQLAYLIEIAAEILPFRMEDIWNEKQYLYQERMKVTLDKFEKQVAQKKEDLHKLFVSVYFGINTDIADRLLNALNPEDLPEGQKDPEAVALARELDLHAVNPKSARTLRRIAIRYLFFANPPAVDWSDISAKNNFMNQRWQYRKDIREMGAPVERFFRETFGSKFTD